MSTIKRTQSILLIGGPSTGKTHYGAQLVGRLQSRQGKLVLHGSPTNITPFEEALKSLGQGISASHTTASTYDEIVLPVDLPGVGSVDLIWPDYGGEQVRQIQEQRRISQEWQSRVEQSASWLLFVRPDHITDFDDLISRPRVTVTAGSDEHADAHWSTQAYLVELLQFLLFVKGVSILQRVQHPALVVLLSCWDELSESDKCLPPAKLLYQKMPLLAAYIAATWEQGQAVTIGLSSLGKALHNDTPDSEYLDMGPEQFGYVVLTSGETSPDLTLPIVTLMKL